jgi:hypothetical protein
MTGLFRTLHEDETTSAANNVFSAVRDFEPAMRDDGNLAVYAVKETAFSFKDLCSRRVIASNPYGCKVRSRGGRRSSNRRASDQTDFPAVELG